MAKPQKIIRYKSIYSSGSKIPPFLGSILLVVVLSLIGWSAYTPVYRFIMDLGEPKPIVMPSQSVEASDTSANVSTESPQTPVENDNNNQTVPVTPTPQTLSKGVYVPFDIVANPTKLDAFLKELKGTGINTVMIHGKNPDGTISYRSQLETAIAAKAVATNAYDARTVANKIAAEGFTPAIKIHAFRDPLAAKGNRGAAVSYLGSDFGWLDNAPENGGKPWLNPYSTEARRYILDITQELAEAGFKEIWVDSVQFPSGVGLHKADFGVDIATQPKLACLQSFAKELEETASRSGAKTSVYVQSIPALQENADLYGGNPLQIPYKSGVVEMLATNYPANTAVGSDTIVENPQESYPKTIAQVSSYAKANLRPDCQMTALITAITKDGAVIPPAALTEQITALGTNTSYILYSPVGKYNLK